MIIALSISLIIVLSIITYGDSNYKSRQDNQKNIMIVPSAATATQVTLPKSESLNYFHLHISEHFILGPSGFTKRRLHSNNSTEWWWIHRGCKFRSDSRVITLYLKWETCSTDCLKAKVRGQPELFALSRLGFRGGHCAALLPRSPSLPLPLACLQKRAHTHIILTEYALMMLIMR